MIESIKIIYDQDSTKEMLFWSELFNLAGAFTYEITQKQVRSFKNKNSNDYSIVLILAKNMNSDDIQHLQSVFPEAISVNDSIINDMYSLNIETNEEKETWKGYFRNGLIVLHDNIKGDIQKEDILALEDIGNVCIEYNIVFYRILFVSLFGESGLLDRCQETQDNFVDAYIHIRNKKQTHYMYWYALTRLGYYMNETCRELSQGQLFENEKADCFLDKSLKTEPFFANAYLMKAMIAENGKDKAKAEEYYLMTLDMIGQKEYASMPFYFCGRYYEKILHDNEKSYMYYEKARNANPLNYKATFKIAKQLYIEKKYSRAAVRFEEAKRILLLEDAAAMIPIDYMYLMKVYGFLENLYGSKLTGELDKYKKICKEKQKAIDDFQNSSLDFKFF